MIYNQLGQSDLEISQVGFGCMSLPTDVNESIKLIHHSLDLGINYYDTADIYNDGLNESIVGKALREKRNNVIIATKVGNQKRADGTGLDWNPSKKHILSGIEKSLERLQTNYIDLYQLHGGTINDNIDETIEAFEMLKQQGKIRYYGISSIRPNVIREYLKKSSIVSVMTQYSLLDRRPEETTLNLLEEHQVGVLVRGSVAQGLLAGKPPREYLGHSPEAVKLASEKINSLSGGHRSSAQTALRYTLLHPAVTSVVVGIRTNIQLEEAASAPDTPSLNDKEIDLLKSSVAPNFYKEHR